jgi:uncharacterized RDD family membrane protein YckC
MIPTMLLVGMFTALFALGGVSQRTVGAMLIVGAVAWGLLVGISASSWTVWLGGTALGAVNAAVGVAVVWCIGWPVRRRNQTPD